MNAVLAKYGTPGQKAAQDMKRKGAVEELRNLSLQQEPIDELQGQLDHAQLMPGQLPGAATSDYYGNLRRKNRIMELTNEVEGRPAPVNKDGGVLSASSALASRAHGSIGAGGGYSATDDGSDNAAYHNRQFAMNDRADRLMGSAADTMRRRENEPTEMLGQSRAAAGRAEYLKDEATKTQAGIDKYNAEDGMRRDAHYDKVHRDRELLPTSPAFVAAQGRQGVADVNADAKLGAAAIAGNARLGSSAVSGLSRMASQPTFTPEDAARVDGGMRDVRPLVPGATGQPAKVFPREKLGAFAQENGFQSEDQAAEYLRTVYGYEVDKPAAAAAPARGFMSKLGDAFSAFGR